MFPSTMANTNSSPENTRACRQRLCVMSSYLPTGSSVKSPSWVCWAAGAQAGEFINSFSSHIAGGMACSQLLPDWVPRPSQAWPARALFWENSKAAGSSGVGSFMGEGKKASMSGRCWLKSQLSHLLPDFSWPNIDSLGYK